MARGFMSEIETVVIFICSNKEIVLIMPKQEKTPLKSTLRPVGVVDELKTAPKCYAKIRKQAVFSLW